MIPLGDIAAAHVGMAGIAIDLAGAALLARGVLASPQQIALNATWGGCVGYLPTAGRAKDRVDAQIGVVTIGIGFFLQGAAVVMQVVDPGANANVSTLLLLAFAAFAVPFVVFRLVHRRLFHRLLIRVAWAAPNQSPVEIALSAYAAAIGYEQTPDERSRDDKRAHATRVFGERALNPPRRHRRAELPPDMK